MDCQPSPLLPLVLPVPTRLPRERGGGKLPLRVTSHAYQPELSIRNHKTILYSISTLCKKSFFLFVKLICYEIIFSLIISIIQKNEHPKAMPLFSTPMIFENYFIRSLICTAERHIHYAVTSICCCSLHGI